METTSQDPFADLRPFIPKLREWVDRTVTTHAGAARSPGSMAFQRLPLYFPGDVGKRLFAETRLVEVENLPKPPLTEWGLEEFRWFEEMDAVGITYDKTCFVTPAADEATHLHELVHAVQWSVLGFDAFVLAYATGLRRCGYRDNVLEVIAFDHQSRFRDGQSAYDVGMSTYCQLGLMFGRKT